MAIESSSLKRTIAKTSDEIIRASKKATQNAPRQKIVWGTIAGITGTTVSITLAGGTVNNIKYLNSYSPTEGDYVMCERYGKDLVCYGTLA